MAKGYKGNHKQEPKGADQMTKQYWLMKSEPDTYSWGDLCAEWDAGDNRDHPGQNPGMWDGVRNYAAAKHMRAMNKGDAVFFYHSQQGLEIVGIAEVVTEYYTDPTDTKSEARKTKFVCVDIKPLRKLPHPVTLSAIKANPKLADMPLIRQGRLSVSPVSSADNAEILSMSGE